MPLSIVRPNPKLAKEPSAVANMLRPHRDLAVKLILFSGVINLMALSVSLYMMQVYDRVLGSQSKDTLFFLTLAVLMAIYGLAVFGYITAVLASFFVGRDAEEPAAPVAGADDIRQLRDEIAALRRALEAKGAISPATKGPCRNAPTGA